jgi:gluconate 2-dehydrogenase gamma chain
MLPRLTMSHSKAPKNPSRRVLVKQLTFMGTGVVLLDGCTETKPKDSPVKDAGAVAKAKPLTSAHRTFTDDEWRTVSAAVDRFLPKDEDPGALDANVPEYIDRILTTPQLKKMKEDFLPGIAALDRRAQRMFKVPFADAKPEQQDELLAIFKNSPEKSGESHWYELLAVLSLEGFLGDPSYGGNKDKVGWQLVGFKLVGGQGVADPKSDYDGRQHLNHLTCSAKGC